MVELRRFVRTPLDVPLTFTAKGKSQPVQARAKDVSVGGMFIETTEVAAFGTEVTVRMRLPQGKGELTLPGVVRWVRADGMGLQFGLLGAKETHEITEVVRKAENG